MCVILCASVCVCVLVCVSVRVFACVVLRMMMADALFSVAPHGLAPPKARGRHCTLSTGCASNQETSLSFPRSLLLSLSLFIALSVSMSEAHC